MPTKENEKGAKPGTDMPTGPTQMMGDIATLQAFGFNAMTDMGVAWVEAVSDMGSEVVTFVADRIKEDVKTQHRMMHCRDMGELQQIQAEFMQKAIDQYRAETGKLVEMSRDLMRTATESAKSN